ncbi:XrtA system polysaccharide deacetylase [Thiosocius teredinicola]|uniref:XrtA system polysaccharide deacetylase n=1 Tax=Thiosocius teredinicola TaxID=1973002 RepID=UPI00099121A8
MAQIRNAMTVDVEDYFQVSAFERYIDRSDWERQECRVERNVDRILGLFSDRDVKATFFTLGWVAERYPALIRRMVEQGHEVASHGMSHVRVTQQNRDEFKQDVVRTKALLEDVSGQEVIGYRAASYSIGASNLWALDVLGETGHLYSSSIYPIKHDLYGMPDAPRFAFRPTDGDFVEFPVTTVRVGGKNLPCGGGGWFRLVPYAGMRWAMRRVNEVDRESVIFYFHPWEIDPDQPRQQGIDAKTRFRHYLNLDRMERRLTRLLSDFEWGRMDQVLFEPHRRHYAKAS